MDHFKEEEEGRLILPLGQEAAALPWLLDPPLLLLLATPSLHLIQAWCFPFFVSERSCQKQKSAQGQAERERQPNKQTHKPIFYDDERQGAVGMVATG